MSKYRVAPVNYWELSWREKREVRERYIEAQNNKCIFCNCVLNEPPPSRITNMQINWSLFPRDFSKYPVHLQHNHDTGMTEGAVHAYCNAVMWQYYGK